MFVTVVNFARWWNVLVLVFEKVTSWERYGEGGRFRRQGNTSEDYQR